MFTVHAPCRYTFSNAFDTQKLSAFACLAWRQLLQLVVQAGALCCFSRRVCMNLGISCGMSANLATTDTLRASAVSIEPLARLCDVQGYFQCSAITRYTRIASPMHHASSRALLKTYGGS